MYFTLLTPNSTPIFKYIVWILGKIMEGLFFVLDKIGIPNIGIAIILFTIFVNVCMIPLTYKQQKFSKMSAIMNPEIQAIQAKYKGTKDPELMQQMQQETNAVYAKYGVSPTGSCVQLLIQMPILFALYRVIYAIPAYVPMVKNEFMALVNSMMGINNAGVVGDADKFMGMAKFIQNSHIENGKTVANFTSFAAYKRQFKPEFLNRIDEIVYFSPLSKEVQGKIVTKMLNELNNRLKENYYSFEFSEPLKDYILENSFSLQFGARPIKRFIQNNVETLIAKEIVQGNLNTDSKYKVDYKDNKIVINKI